MEQPALFSEKKFRIIIDTFHFLLLLLLSLFIHCRVVVVVIYISVSDVHPKRCVYDHIILSQRSISLFGVNINFSQHMQSISSIHTLYIYMLNIIIVIPLLQNILLYVLIDVDDYSVCDVLCPPTQPIIVKCTRVCT